MKTVDKIIGIEYEEKEDGQVVFDKENFEKLMHLFGELSKEIAILEETKNT